MANTLSPSFMKLLHEVCADAEGGYSVRSYSGRAMYGKECLAIMCDQGGSPSAFWAHCIDAIIINAEDNTNLAEDTLALIQKHISDLSNLMFKISEDSMGLGRVFYNPSVTWREEYDADFEEPSEDDESDEEGDGSEDEKNASETGVSDGNGGWVGLPGWVKPETSAT